MSGIREDRLNFIHLLNGAFTVDHINGARTMETPIFSCDSIRVGCTETTIEALRELLKQWESRYGAAPWNRREGV
jgi:hypothetical protein